VLQVETDQANMESRVAVGKAIDILVNSLSRPEFEEVRDIMTSKSVLDDPDLARNIATAFLLVERSVENRRKVRYELPQHLDDGRYQAA
jgi:hypothetical protein